MKYLTHKAKIQCIHGGEVKLNPPGKRSLTINGEAIVCKEDLENATILNCPVPRSNSSKPCEKVIALLMGQSRGVEVNGKTPLLQTVMALSDCLPAPGLCSAVNDGNSVMQIKLPGVNLGSATSSQPENAAKTTSNITSANNTTNNNQASVVPTKDKIFQPDSKQTGWFELTLKDDLNKALEGEWVRIVFPDQKVYDNVLNKHGKVSVKDTPTGTCKVYFPNLKDRWPPEPNPKKLDYLELVTNKPHKLTIESTDWFTDIIPIIILPGVLGTRLMDPDTKEMIFDPPTFRFPSRSLNITLFKPSRLKEIEKPLIPATSYDAPKPAYFSEDDPWDDNERLKYKKYIADLLEKIKKIENFSHCVASYYEELAFSLSDTTFANEIKEKLQGIKNVKEVRVHFFGYDWRQDCATHANDLDNLINKVLQQTVAKKVIIIAHSMGGLVSRYYCCAKQPETGKAKGEDKVKALILVGSPTHGAPKAYRFLKQGVDIGEYLNNFVIKYDLTYLARLARHFPSVYQLLPTKFYCENVQSWLQHNNSPHPFNHDFIYKELTIGSEDLSKIVSNNLKNREAFEQALGKTMPNPLKITTHIIYSESYSTEVGYELKLNKNPQFTLTHIYDFGDKTVPSFSARAYGCDITGERISIDDKDYDHAKLLNSPKVIKEVKRLIFKELGFEIKRDDTEVKPEKEHPDIFERHIFLEYIGHHIVYEPEALKDPEQIKVLKKAGYDTETIYWEEGLYGFQACLLLPDNSIENPPNPILAIRGTYSYGGISTDFDFWQVGHNQFKYNEDKIKNLFNKTNKKVDLTGHSLGGAVAQIIASYPHFYSRIDNVVTFQSPGVMYFSYDRFNNISQPTQPIITHHVVSGDIVDLAGGFRLPGIIYEHNYPILKLNPYPHTIFVFATAEFQELREKVGLKDEFIKNIFKQEIRTQSIGYITYPSDPYRWRRKIVESGRSIVSILLAPLTIYYDKNYDKDYFYYKLLLPKVTNNIKAILKKDYQKLEEVKAKYMKEGFSEQKARVYALYQLGYLESDPETFCQINGIN